MRTSAMLRPLNLAALLCFAGYALTHEHHMDDIPEGEGISAEPIDTILWIHIGIQILSFGIVFPTGMVLGIVRSRWHVPLQTLGAVLAIVGYFLGHEHGGRQFAPNVHASMATMLMLMLLVQVILGVYLKLHLEKGIHARIRRYTIMMHGMMGKAMPVASWVQMLFGGITALGFCRGDHLGQCLAHFIMGSAFIGYGIILTILLLVGQIWLKRSGRSQEFFDSLLIAAWGCVNTFTEHRWGGPWVKNDLQHTSMGIVWWCAGLLGVWLSRKRDGRPKRNLFPAVVIMLTGWGMSAHPQELELSTHVHTVFGYTLMAAGAVRIVEIAFVLKDQNSISDTDAEDTNSFQYLTPFLLYTSGFLFMGATEEQMALLATAHVSHVSYILLLYSISFLLFLFVCILLHLYASYAWPLKTLNTNQTTKNQNLTANGNGHVLPNNERRVRDAEEFELEGLMSDDDEDVVSEESSSGGGRRKEAGRTTN
ncbi:hypothetical protein JMJ35_005014 [Cladonia borealis]|uniref:Integral membrane protein n=1 Tax=Cladonia borealis TaxID=184061 RepID=A0AA39V286_9LECA|nr:hypothetical protein JMJ35_005014 [Cladonia borealis]